MILFGCLLVYFFIRLNKIILIFGVIGVVIIGWIAISRIGIEPAKLAAAPDFSLEDYEGNIVNLADFAGKNIIVNSWAVWCPFCVEELKDFANLEHEFGDDIVIIAIDRAESLEKQKRYTDDLGVTDDLVFLLDPKDSFYRSIGGFSMPETIFVDGEGNIVFHKRGPMKFEEMKAKVQQFFSI